MSCVGLAGLTSVTKSSNSVSLSVSLSVSSIGDDAPSSPLGRSRRRPRRLRLRRPSGLAAPAGPAGPALENESGSSSSASSAIRGSDSALSRGSPSRSGQSDEGGNTSGARMCRITGTQPLAARDVAWLAGPIVRLRPFAVATTIARWLGRSRNTATFDIAPACSAAGGGAAVRSSKSPGSGQLLRERDVPAPGPGWEGSPRREPSQSPPRERMAALPPRRRGGSSCRGEPSKSGPPIRPSRSAPGSMSGITEPSVPRGGGTGRDRPVGAGLPRPRLLRGSGPPKGSISGSPAPVRGHSSVGDGSEGGTRCRLRSWPSNSPGRADPGELCCR